MLSLTHREWTRLYKEVLLFALRRTWTKDKARQWTARDRAQEAVQRAFDRYLRIDPADVVDLDTARRWLVWRVRSELSHVVDREIARKEAEKAATVEDATVMGKSAPSPEQLHLDQGQEVASESRAVRVVEALRAELRKNGDTRALETMDLIAQDKAAPEVQAAILGCDVEEIYNARKRRKRAMEKVLAEIDGGGSSGDGGAS